MKRQRSRWGCLLTAIAMIVCCFGSVPAGEGEGEGEGAAPGHGGLGRADLKTSALPLPKTTLSNWSATTEVGAGGRRHRRGIVLVKFAGAAFVSAVRVAPGREVAAARALAQREDVLFAECDRLAERLFVPSDPAFAQQWHHATLNSSQAWDLIRGSAEVRVGIVDAVFEMDHPDLAAHVDPGWDVINETPVYAYQVPGYYPYDDHATLSAGLVAGVMDNAVGVAGMAECRIVPIRVNGFVSEFYHAILWAASNQVRVVNISWDVADSPTLNDAAAVLRQSMDGVVLVAGGNGSGPLAYPDYPYLTAVAMTDSNDVQQSKHGPHIDYAAPGMEVYATLTPSAYGAASGTSFAAPIVSGVVAALFAIDPALTASNVLTALKYSSVDLGAPGRDPYYGWGRVDFYAAAWLAAAMTLSNQPSWRIEDIVLSNAVAELSTSFHRGATAELWRTDNLLTGSWHVVSAQPSTNGSVLRLRDPSPPQRAAFYRVKASLPR